MAQPGSLLRHGDFLKLWVGQTVSQFGNQFTGIALPLIAVLTLQANEAEMGILAAMGTFPFLFIGLFVGVLVDRRRRRAILIASDLGRGMIVSAVAILAFLGTLRIVHLYVLGFLTGVLTVFFDVSYQAYLPALVDRVQLVDANSKLEASNSTANVAGPTLAGVVIKVLSAPIAMVLDALSFAFSAFTLGLIRKPEAAPDPSGRRSMLTEAREGLSVVFGDRRLWSIAGSTGTSNFFANVVFALYFLFAIRELGIDALGIGLVFGVGSVGALTGAVLASRLAAAIGVGRVIVGSIFLGGVSTAVILLATPGVAIPILILSNFGAGMGAVMYNINQVSLRQAIVPLRLQGRMNATMRFLVWGTLPLGGLTGGFLGSVLGLRSAITIGAVGGLFAFLWVFLSPVRSLPAIPESQG